MATAGISRIWSDTFSDPGDLQDQIPGETEWVGCQPYEITAIWCSMGYGWVIGSGSPQ